VLIQYYVKEHYGEKRYYAIDPNIAKAIGEISGNKTITTRVKNGLKSLGHRFEQIHENSDYRVPNRFSKVNSQP